MFGLDNTQGVSLISVRLSPTQDDLSSLEFHRWVWQIHFFFHKLRIS